MQEFTSKGQLIQFAGVPAHNLVLRGVATVFSTDYIFDVTFHLNGVVETAVAISGYTHAAPWNGASLNVSYPLYYDVGGLVANHWANWKASLPYFCHKPPSQLIAEWYARFVILRPHN